LVPQGQQKIPVFGEIIKDLVHPHMQLPAIKEKFHHKVALWSKRKKKEGKYAWGRRFKWPESAALTA